MNIKKWLRIGLGIGFGAVLSCAVTGVALSLVLGRNIIDVINEEGHYSLGKLNKIDYILNRRVALNKIEEDKLTDNIFLGYVYGLKDPNTRYLSKEKFEEYQVIAEGNYVGVGFEFAWGITGQYILVTDVMEKSPADREGIKVGDRIIMIDSIRAKLSNEKELYEKLTYTGDEEVTYTFGDEENRVLREVKLKAEVVETTSFTSEILDGNIGYIKVANIKKDTAEALEKELTSLENKGISNLIFDIRSCYSDKIDEVFEICDLFFDEGMAFSVKRKNGEVKKYENTPGQYKGNLAVLIDNNTEGAIEAFVGAIKDLKRGKLIGDATKGNAIVEETKVLDDESALVISVGKIYTPNGQEIGEKGIEPDFKVIMSEEAIVELLTKGSVSKENDDSISKGITYLNELKGK